MPDLPFRTSGSLSGVGTVASPTSGDVSAVATTMGSCTRIDFTLTRARIPVTDGGVSGSFGSLKIFDFNEMAMTFVGCRQDYTAFVEGSALTTAAGDAVHVLGVGTTNISAARDGTLTGNEQNVGTVTAQITNVAGTGAGTQVTGAVATAINGTATAADLFLNWSGTATTIDANSTIDVTGTISVAVSMLGDD